MTVQLPAGIQHGTPEGYAAGCRREKDCPALHEHGMCCLYAHVRSITDIRYHRAHARDPRPAAIARALGIRTPGHTERLQNDREAELDQQFNDRPAGYVWHGNRTHRPTATPTPEPTPKETPMPTPNDVAKTSKPLTVEPITEISEDLDTTPDALAEAPAVAAEPTPRGIRDWARLVGVDCPAMGRVPKHVRQLYDDAHPTTAGASIAGPPTTATTPAVPEPIQEEETTLTPALSAALSGIMNVDGEIVEVTLEGAAVEGAIVDLAAAEDALAVSVVRTCRGCGCTDWDCAGCIERTGAPCSWIDDDLCSACLPVALPEAEFPEAMGQARERAELVELNRDADGEPDLPVAVGQQTVIETPTAVVYRDVPAAPRPEWADVTIPEDIERARALAVRLEQELAHTEEQLATAHAALDTTLAKWNADTTALQEKITQLTVDLRAALQTASIWSGLYHDVSTEIMRHRLRGEQKIAQYLQHIWDADDAAIRTAAPRRLFDVTTWFKRGN